jgi:LysR family transcriptional regulator, transcriptional activator of nhaA
LAVRERFYAISPQRKLKHPAVLAILESARAGLFDVPDVRGKV